MASALVLIVLPTEYVTKPKIPNNILIINNETIHRVPKLTNSGSETNEFGFRN